MTPLNEMFDYDLRVKNMSKAKVDMAIVSLTCPNVFWGDGQISLKAAKVMNDDMTRGQSAYPDRIRWFASLPWQYADDAKAELARCVKDGAADVPLALATGPVDDLARHRPNQGMDLCQKDAKFVPHSRDTSTREQPTAGSEIRKLLCSILLQANNGC